MHAVAFFRTNPTLFPLAALGKGTPGSLLRFFILSRDPWYPNCTQLWLVSPLLRAIAIARGYYLSVSECQFTRRISIEKAWFDRHRPTSQWSYKSKNVSLSSNLEYRNRLSEDSIVSNLCSLCSSSIIRHCIAWPISLVMSTTALQTDGPSHLCDPSTASISGSPMPSAINHFVSEGSRTLDGTTLRTIDQLKFLSMISRWNHSSSPPITSAWSSALGRDRHCPISV